MPVVTYPRTPIAPMPSLPTAILSGAVKVPFTKAQLDNWFTYHAPRNEAEVEGYRQLGLAYKHALEVAVMAVRKGVYTVANTKGIVPGTDVSPKDFQEVFDEVNAAL